MKLLIMATTACFTLMPSLADEPKDKQGENIKATVAIEVPAAERLSDVKKIFVASLGATDGAELIRQKLINRLIQSGAFSVTESAQDADATLTGAGLISTGFYCNRYGGHSYASANIVLRLVSRDKQILWMDERRPRFFGSQNASSNVADRIVKDLCKAISKDREAQISKTQAAATY